MLTRTLSSINAQLHMHEAFVVVVRDSLTNSVRGPLVAVFMDTVDVSCSAAETQCYVAIR